MEAEIRALKRRLYSVLCGSIAVMTVLVFLGVFVQYASSQSPVVRTRRVEIVDSGGKNRIVLGVESGSPTLMLFDHLGKQRAGMFILPDGDPALGLADGTGRIRIGLGVRRDGSPTLALRDAAGKVRVEMDFNSERPVLRFLDGSGQVRLGIAVTSDGSAGIQIYDPAGRVLFQAP